MQSRADTAEATLRAQRRIAARLEKDLASPEVKATLEENFRLAENMGLNGTPSYVIGAEIFWGQDRLDFVARRLARG